MRVLITGATGQVGQEVRLTCYKKDWQVFAYSSQELDITNPRQVQYCFNKDRPEYIINCAAYTKVDLAEDEKDQAFLVNTEGVRILAESCKQYSIPLIHLSTDYIFDGSKTNAYQEYDVPNPQNVYGQSKWAGEKMLQSIWNQHIILRISWVFGRFGNNFVKTMLRLKDKQILKIVADQHGSPTGTYHIANVIIKLIEHPDLKKNFGVYHYTDYSTVSWFDFAKIIFETAYSQGLIDKFPELSAISTSEYAAKALRPLNSEMDCTKIKNTFGIHQAPWHEELNLVLKYLKKESD